LAVKSNIKNVTAAIEWFEALTTSLELTVPTIQSKEQLEDLTNSVNLQRLRNNPIKLDRLAIKEIYLDILQ
jgi:alcohol dehydrogenase class IV